jgi:hypothetical protein
LNDNEINALSHLFPGLQSRNRFVDPSRGELNEPVDLELEGFDELARVEKVPEPYAGQAMKTSHSVVEGILGSGLSFLLLALALGVPALLFKTVKPMPEWLAATLVFGMMSVLIGNVIFLLWFSDYFAVRYRRKVLQAALEQRPDAWLNPRSPDTIYVEIVPRSQWSKSVPSPTDIGLLQINQQRRELIFEGDKERFRIPRDALGGILVESFNDLSTRNQRSAGRSIYVVVLYTVDQFGSSRQFCLVQRQTRFEPWTNARRHAAASELEKRIWSSIDPAEE